MFGIKKFLFGGAPAEHLPEDVRQAVSRWQSGEGEGLETSHFLTRYVIVDIATDGMKPESDRLLGISAVVVQHGVISPEHCLHLDLSSAESGNFTVDRQLAAFLQFVGHSPLVTYHVAFVRGFLEQAIKNRLGVSFESRWVDLAWLMPAMFPETMMRPAPLDDWLQAFGMEAGEGRRSTMDNTLVLARLLQRLLIRAHAKEVDTVEALIDESRASSALRGSR